MQGAVGLGRSKKGEGGGDRAKCLEPGNFLVTFAPVILHYIGGTTCRKIQSGRTGMNF